MSSAFSTFGREKRVSVEAPDVDSTLITTSMCEGLAGASARDIVQKTDSLGGRVRNAFDKRFGAAYLKKLEVAKASNRVARDSLALFKVESARLEQTAGFIGLETTIVMTVLNGTGHTIKRAYFSSVAQTEGREVPWIEETFNYSVAGGLAPGERATWRLQPNMFAGDWNKVRVPRDARFVVEAVKLDGPDGVPLFGGAEFTKGDQRLLDSLAKVVGK